MKSSSIKDVEGIVRAHKQLYSKLAEWMRQPVERDPELDYAGKARNVHHKFRLMPTMKDLVIIVDKPGSLDPALLVILEPNRAQGIPALESASAEQRDLDGVKVVEVRMAMEDIMRVVVEMQIKAEKGGEKGISGIYSNFEVNED